MITDEEGNPAPRLSDVKLTIEQAREYHQILIRQAVLMLCAGIIHGDFSEFNVLLSHKGLVIIDMPQAVQATANNAFEIFERDLMQLAAFFGRIDPELAKTEYAKEIWKLYEHGKLSPTSKLTGTFTQSTKRANVREVMEQIDMARDDELVRRGIKPKRPY
jgi:RIO kinase 1